MSGSSSSERPTAEEWPAGQYPYCEPDSTAPIYKQMLAWQPNVRKYEEDFWGTYRDLLNDDVELTENVSYDLAKFFDSSNPDVCKSTSGPLNAIVYDCFMHPSYLTADGQTKYGLFGLGLVLLSEMSRLNVLRSYCIDSVGVGIFVDNQDPESWERSIWTLPQELPEHMEETFQNITPHQWLPGFAILICRANEIDERTRSTRLGAAAMETYLIAAAEFLNMIYDDQPIAVEEDSDDRSATSSRSSDSERDDENTRYAFTFALLLCLSGKMCTQLIVHAIEKMQPEQWFNLILYAKNLLDDPQEQVIRDNYNFLVAHLQVLAPLRFAELNAQFGNVVTVTQEFGFRGGFAPPAAAPDPKRRRRRP